MNTDEHGYSGMSGLLELLEGVIAVRFMFSFVFIRVHPCQSELDQLLHRTRVLSVVSIA